jgi:hypothetical protein
VVIAAGATSGAITFGAHVMSVEQYSNTNIIVDEAASEPPRLTIQVGLIQVVVTSSLVVAGDKFVGESFQVRVDITNQGTSPTINGELRPNTQAGISYDTTLYTGITVNPTQTVSRLFLVTATTFNGTFGFIADFDGRDQGSGQPINITAAALNIVIRRHQILNIVLMAYSTGNGTYVQGMTVDITVTLRN